jgi:hypothetical protein
MTEAARAMEDAQAVLDRLGIVVAPEDLPFLQRTLVRQREFLRLLAQQVPPDTEPAHVFRPVSD